RPHVGPVQTGGLALGVDLVDEGGRGRVVGGAHHVAQLGGGQRPGCAGAGGGERSGQCGQPGGQVAADLLGATALAGAADGAEGDGDVGAHGAGSARVGLHRLGQHASGEFRRVGVDVGGDLAAQPV